MPIVLHLALTCLSKIIKDKSSLHCKLLWRKNSLEPDDQTDKLLLVVFYKSIALYTLLIDSIPLVPCYVP